MNLMESSADVKSPSLQMSRHLLKLMQEGAWDEAAVLEVERGRMIRQEFAAGSQTGAEEKIRTLREIARINQEIEAIGRNARSRIAKQLRQLHQGRKAGKVYRQTP